ncbi:12256_t:CDS:2, partial [Racocetra persica]
PVADIEDGIKEIISVADKVIDDFEKETEAEVEMAQEEKLLAKKAASETKLTNLRDKLDRRNKAIAELEKKIKDLKDKESG